MEMLVIMGRGGGNANGFEGDSNGLVYQLMPEYNAVYFYDSTPNSNGKTNAFVRDPRILWPDGASIGADGYIYLNINQLFDQVSPVIRFPLYRHDVVLMLIIPRRPTGTSEWTQERTLARS